MDKDECKENGERMRGEITKKWREKTNMKGIIYECDRKGLNKRLYGACTDCLGMLKKPLC